MLALHSAANRSFQVFNLTIQMKRFTLIIPFLLILLPLLAQENPIATRDSLYGGCLPTPKREYDAMPRVDWEAMGLTPRDAHPSRLVLNHPPRRQPGARGVLHRMGAGLLHCGRTFTLLRLQCHPSERSLLPFLQRRGLPRTSNEFRGRKWGLLPRANALQ